MNEHLKLDESFPPLVISNFKMRKIIFVKIENIIKTQQR